MKPFKLKIALLGVTMLWLILSAQSQTITFPLTESLTSVSGEQTLMPLANDMGISGTFGAVSVPASSCLTTVTTGAYSFPENAGLHYQNAGFITAAYSLEMTFKIDQLTIRSGRSVDWVNLVSFNQTLSDQGIYIRIGATGTGRLQFWDSNTSQRNITNDVFNETDVFHLVITRSTAGQFTIYLNGVATEVNYDDSDGNYLPNATDDAIYLFRDFPLENITSITQKLDDEASSGWVKGLNITNTTWTQAEVTDRWESVCERLIDVQFAATATCLNDETQFEIQTALPGADSIVWDFGDSESASNTATGLTATHVFSSALSFNVIATVYYGAIPTPFNQSVIINSLPFLSLGADITLNEGETVTLNAGNAGASYVWQDNSNQSTFEVSTTGTYSVQVTDLNGCVASDTIEVSYRTTELLPVSVPNAFTPNGDGENDLWIIDHLDGYPANRLRLFDRQGNLVREWQPYDNSWDGLINRTTEALGTYFYLLSNNNEVLKTGSVSIIR